MEMETRKQILERRKEIEQELVDLLKETNAWNYFPHKLLGGLSPQEKLSGHYNIPTFLRI